MRRLCILKMSTAFTALFVFFPVAMAQSTVPTAGILFRVMMVRSQLDQGTIFSIDVDQREYWITAKHILTGAKHPPFGSVSSKTVTLQILDFDTSEEKWLPETFSVLDPGPDIDLVVMVASEPILTGPLPGLVAAADSVLMGGDCEFLGYPFGAAWQAKFKGNISTRMPFIKHCTVSGLVETPQKFWVLDGINNIGFSGGPVIYQAGENQKIMAVVSGYRTEPMEVTAVPPEKAPAKDKSDESAKSAEHPKEMVNVNSGFIVAYDIGYAIDVIKKNPVGAVRKPK